ncbi:MULTISPECIES: RNA polymerase sigma factor [Chitinophagaceae]
MESELLEQLINGDLIAFKEIYQSYYSPVKRNILKFVQQEADAEDILQEVFIALWNKKENLDKNGHIGNWLFAVSYNRSMRFIKQRLKIANLSTDAMEGHYTVESDGVGILDEEKFYVEKINLLKNAINLLPEQKRKAFELYNVRGYNYTKIAEEMGLSEKTVRQYVKLANSFLRRTVQIKKTEWQVLSTISFCLLTTLG